LKSLFEAHSGGQWEFRTYKVLSGLLQGAADVTADVTDSLPLGFPRYSYTLGLGGAFAFNRLLPRRLSRLLSRHPVEFPAAVLHSGEQPLWGNVHGLLEFAGCLGWIMPTQEHITLAY
jgi:hypothetical protein